MRVTVTGATGLIGSKLVQALKARGDEVTVLSRDPAKASAALGVQAEAWRPMDEPAPAHALAGRDAVVHLAGEEIAQRWNDETKRAIRDSREIGTRNLVAGVAAADPRPDALVCASGVGYYGKHGDEVVDETTPAGDDFLAEVCVVWEARGRAGRRARRAGLQPAHRRRARPPRRRAGQDADAVQARRRRPGGQRPPVPAVDRRRRPHRHLPGRDRRRGLERGDQRGRRPSP